MVVSDQVDAGLGSIQSSSSAAGHRAAPWAGATGAPIFIDGDLYLLKVVKEQKWSVVYNKLHKYFTEMWFCFAFFLQYTQNSE